ncbi:MAG TPA: hypothetical protein ENH02_04560, partial [Bacteroidetes bacterium]|nr:hypothetical protein [Bacteroidota bacterium]
MKRKPKTSRHKITLFQIAGLEFFYPRLAPGGIIIIHDYNPDWPGIMKAVDDFAATIPEPLIVMPDQDSSVMV